jgi:hypothetical protein
MLQHEYFEFLFFKALAAGVRYAGIRCISNCCRDKANGAYASLSDLANSITALSVGAYGGATVLSHTGAAKRVSTTCTQLFQNRQGCCLANISSLFYCPFQGVTICPVQWPHIVFFEFFNAREHKLSIKSSLMLSLMLHQH